MALQERGDFVLERANSSDFQEILSISENVYEGLDYIPHVFPHWIDEATADTSGRHCLVLKDKTSGKIVGYQSLMFQNGGDFAVQQALRVDESVRKAGLGKICHDLGIRHYKSLVPHGKIIKSVATQNCPAKVIEHWKPNFLLKRSTIDFRLKTNRLIEKFIEENSDKSLKKITWENFCRILRTNEKAREICTTNDFMMIEWTPYHMNALERMPKVYCCDFSILVDDLENPRSFSVASIPYIAEVGTKSSIDIFAANDASATKAHFATQLDIVRRDVPDLRVFLWTDLEIAPEIYDLVHDELRQSTLIRRRFGTEERCNYSYAYIFNLA